MLLIADKAHAASRALACCHAHSKNREATVEHAAA
jgi:hypothetical protein